MNSPRRPPSLSPQLEIHNFNFSRPSPMRVQVIISSGENSEAKKYHRVSYSTNAFPAVAAVLPSSKVRNAEQQRGVPGPGRVKTNCEERDGDDEEELLLYLYTYLTSNLIGR